MQSTLEYLVNEVRNLKASSQTSINTTDIQNVSDSPGRLSLKKMNEEQYKSFRVS